MDGATATPDVSTDNQGPVAPPSWADSQPAQQTQPASPQQAPQPSAMPPMGEPQIPKQAQQPQQPPVVTITPQKRGGILGVVDSVMDALTGTTKPEIATGSDGNQYVNKAPIGHAAQWMRLGAEALQGAAAGMAAGRGNNAGGAFAAGVNKGVDIGNQRAQAPQKMSEEAQQANLEKANMQMVAMRNAQLAWTLKHEQVQASQELVKFAEEEAEWMSKHNGRLIGHMNDHGDLGDVLKNDPDAPKSLVNDSAIKPIPTFDKDGNSTGADIYKVDPDWNDVMQPAGTAFNVFDTTTGKQTVVHSPVPMSNGRIYTLNAQAQNAEMEFRKKQADIEKEQAETQAAKDKSANAPFERKEIEARTNQANAAAYKDKTAADKMKTGVLTPDGQPNPRFEALAQALYDGDLLPKDLKRESKGAGFDPNDLMGRAIEIGQAAGKPWSASMIEQENKFAESTKVQAALDGVDRIIGKPGQQGAGYLNQALNLAEKANLGTNGAYNSGELAVRRFFGDTEAKNFATAVSETRRSIAGLIGNPVLGGSDSDKKLQQADEMLGEKPTLENLRGAAAVLKNALETQRQSMIGNNRFLAKRYGAAVPTSTPAQPASPQSAPPAGAIGKVPGSDGKLHWTDGKTDLGVVQ